MTTAARVWGTGAAEPAKVVTQADYEDALAAAKRRIGDLKLKEANRAITIERPF
jgi:predicted metalloprotease